MFESVGGPSTQHLQTVVAAIQCDALSSQLITLQKGLEAVEEAIPFSCDREALNAAKLAYERDENVVDAAIELETLPEKTATGEAHAAEALLPDPNLCVALLRVRKMAFPGPGAVAPSPLTRMDRAYALQVRRRRLAVRPLRIAPEDAANGAGHAPDGRTGKTRQSKPLCGGGPTDASDALDF